MYLKPCFLKTCGVPTWKADSLSPEYPPLPIQAEHSWSICVILFQCLKILHYKYWMCSLQVCGAPDNSSGGCIDSQCGGEGCNGTVSLSAAALDKAQNLTGHLTAAEEDLQGVTTKVPSTSRKPSEALLVRLLSVLFPEHSSRTSPL